MKMRKRVRIGLWLLLLLLALGGCQAGGGPLLPKGALFVRGCYTKNGIDYAVEIAKEADGRGTVLYTSPQTVKGMRFLCDEDGVTLQQGSLSLSLGRLEHDAAILLSLFSLDEETLQRTHAEGSGTSLAFDNVTVFIDKASGLPASFQSRIGGREILLMIEEMVCQEG